MNPERQYVTLDEKDVDAVITLVERCEAVTATLRRLLDRPRRQRRLDGRAAHDTLNDD